MSQEINIIAQKVEKLDMAIFGPEGVLARMLRLETKVNTAVQLLGFITVLAVPSAISIVGIAVSFFR